MPLNNLSQQHPDPGTTANMKQVLLAVLTDLNAFGKNLTPKSASSLAASTSATS